MNGFGTFRGVQWTGSRLSGRSREYISIRAPTTLICLLLLVMPMAVEGQSTGFVRGIVQDPSAAGGITGAMLQIVDADSSVVERSFSGANGHFLMEVTEGGPYVIRAESMGFRGTTSQPFEIVPGDTLQLPRLSLLPDPVRRTPRDAASASESRLYRSSPIDPPKYAFLPGPGSK